MTQAEEAYRAANRRGFEPQPGLALLRLAQGRTDAASAAIRRLIGVARVREIRGRMLPAYFEIMLATDNREEAQRACEALEALRSEFGTVSVQAQAAQARGAWCLHRGDAHHALEFLRESFALWERMPVPYEAARVRVLLAKACEALGDNDTAVLERDAARGTFEQLGARPDLERLDASCAKASTDGTLTARELEVIRLVAQGFTNKAIANALHLSTRTVDRHIANILGKLDVPSRAAAIAAAAAHRLL
jgi:ATP/maltotriose-dependent transcriptional regulator MalT